MKKKKIGAVVIGGHVNALSIARSLSKRGIEVYTVSDDPLSLTRFSRHAKFTEKNDIPIPKTIFPRGIYELNDLLETLKFPVALKLVAPLSFQEKKLKVIAYSRKELLQRYKEFCSFVKPPEIMIDEYIPGPCELQYSFGSFFKQKEPIGIFVGRKLRQRPIDFGTGTLCDSIWVPEVVDLGIRLLKAVNYYGVSEIEFKKDPRDNKFKLIEINTRLWGFHGLAKRCGVNFAYMLYRDALGEEIQQIEKFKENIKWIHIYTDLLATYMEMKNGDFVLKKYLQSVKGKKDFAVLSLRDPFPFIVETFLSLIKVKKYLYEEY
jgi:predicted ATP-grasp superfamily ATP-dependent carboligase